MQRKPSLESVLVRRFGEGLLNPSFPRLTHDLLMEASHECVKDASMSGQPDVEIVVARLLENPAIYKEWESEHASMMRSVAAERLPAAQRSSMLSASFSLIHRKALFEYLKDKKVRGERRELLVKHFSPQRDFTHSMHREHMRYVRSSASYLCVEHVGRDLMFDTLFADPLNEYEDLYKEYFHAHCDQIAADPDAFGIPPDVLTVLKNRVSEWRKALLALSHSQSGTWRRPKL